MQSRFTKTQLKKMKWLWDIGVKTSDIAHFFGVTSPAITYYVNPVGRNKRLPVQKVIKHYFKEAA